MTDTAMTVTGRAPIAELGRVMLHEHLLSLLPGPWTNGRGIDDGIAAAVRALSGLRERGIGTVVDLSPYGVVGRDPDGANTRLLVRIAEETGLRIVSGTAVYLESYAPGWALDASEAQLTERFVSDALTGIGDTGVRAGIYGEQATSLGRITPFESRVLRAMAAAHRETGLAIMTHTTHGTMAIDQIELLEAAGADLDRVVIGHIDTQLDPGLARRVIEAGARIGIDTIGKQNWDFFLGPEPDQRDEGEYAKRSFFRSDAGRADLVADLVADGFASRIVLAQDLTGAEVWMNRPTLGQWGYSYLDQVFLPLLRDRGVTEAQIDQMLVDTPARLLETA